jgi:hypothetical protein
MNKRLLLVGAVAVAGTLTLAGFKAKTLAEQKAEIDAAIKTELETLRTQKEEECTNKVTVEAQRMMEDYRVEAEAAAAAAKGGKKMAAPVKPKSTTKPAPKGPKVDPLPQPTKPVDPQKQRGGAVEEGKPVTPQEQKKRGGAVEEAKPDTKIDVQQQKRRGGAEATPNGGGGEF